MDVMSASKYSLDMQTQRKLKVAITRKIIKALGKIQVTELTAQDDKRQTKFGKQLLIKTLHERRQSLLIINLFIKAKKGAINFGTDATRHRHAMTNAVQQTLDPRPNGGIVQHTVMITGSAHDGMRPCL